MTRYNGEGQARHAAAIADIFAFDAATTDEYG